MLQAPTAGGNSQTEAPPVAAACKKVQKVTRYARHTNDQQDPLDNTCYVAIRMIHSGG
jgi:hypothetical protein